ncbi:Bor family protein [Pontibacter sp. H259]|uniref:Bor family protein n=1 Tax=Pontibacter sp. H259 TaxID=3133421 RepID=UPI0030BB8740
MKRTVKMLAATLLMSSMLTSCYTYTMTVGKGAQGNAQVKKMNHYLIYGLAPINVSNPAEMAGGAKDYTVTIEHTIVDGIINAVTFGIYTPTTTVVTK